MKVVYIAGPFRGPSAWDIECNIRRAEERALSVWRLGAVAVCPHANSRFFQGAAPDDVWLRGDLELLSRCDAVLLTSEWESSLGTLVEIIKAMDLNIPVFTKFSSLAVWFYHETVVEVQSEIKAKAVQLCDTRRAKARSGTGQSQP